MEVYLVHCIFEDTFEGITESVYTCFSLDEANELAETHKSFCDITIYKAVELRSYSRNEWEIFE